MPNGAPQRLIDSPNGLSLIPTQTISSSTAGVQKVLLEDDSQVVPCRVRDADHHYRATLLVSEVNAFAELPAAHSRQDGAVRTSLDGVGVVAQDLLCLFISLRLFEERLLTRDLRQEAVLPPALQDRILHAVGGECEQHPFGSLSGQDLHCRTELLDVRELVPVDIGRIQAGLLRTFRHHRGQQLFPRVDHVGVLQNNRKRHAEGFRRALDR
mmetsp:Transcript_15598/g.36799  ORF Transcript_15598/g.36799 Transcript_15598/m.36799 type:complete len:212 (-) Transcript_15598:1401-2036(-)